MTGSSGSDSTNPTRTCFRWSDGAERDRAALPAGTGLDGAAQGGLAGGRYLEPADALSDRPHPSRDPTLLPESERPRAADLRDDRQPPRPHEHRARGQPVAHLAGPE